MTKPTFLKTYKLQAYTNYKIEKFYEIIPMQVFGRLVEQGVILSDKLASHGLGGDVVDGGSWVGSLGRVWRVGRCRCGRSRLRRSRRIGGHYHDCTTVGRIHHNFLSNSSETQSHVHALNKCKKTTENIL